MRPRAPDARQPSVALAATFGDFCCRHDERAWRSATAARTARVGTLHDGRRWPSTEIGGTADEEAIGRVRFRRAGALLWRRIGARTDARAARRLGCSGIFAGHVAGAIASSDAARGQNPRTGNDRCAGRRNDGAGAEVRGSMVRPVRAQAAVGDTGSCAIDRRNAGEGVGGGTGERRRPAGLTRRSIERFVGLRREGGCRAPRRPRATIVFRAISGRHEGSRWAAIWPNQHRKLLWTRVAPFPSSRLESALRCPMCGSRGGPLRPTATDVRGAPRCLAKMVEVPNPLKFLG